MVTGQVSMFEMPYIASLMPRHTCMCEKRVWCSATHFFVTCRVRLLSNFELVCQARSWVDRLIYFERVIICAGCMYLNSKALLQVNLQHKTLAHF